MNQPTSLKRIAPESERPSPTWWDLYVVYNPGAKKFPGGMICGTVVAAENGSTPAVEILKSNGFWASLRFMFQHMEARKACDCALHSFVRRRPDALATLERFKASERKHETIPRRTWG